MRLLAIADLHHAPGGSAQAECDEYRFGVELVLRAVLDATRRGRVDVVVLLGDLLHDGSSPGAAEALAEIACIVSSRLPGARVLAAAGNHDGPAAERFESYGWETGPCRIDGCRFYVFRDPYAEGDLCTRTDAERAAFADFASTGDGPLIAIQHNPIVPSIDDAYPYNHTNRETILADYERCGVALSISGHYHDGLPLETVRGCTYLTVSALAFPRLSYAIVDIRDGRADAATYSLRVDRGCDLVDSHYHVEFLESLAAGGDIAGLLWSVGKG
jgi:hypothetical protein